MPIRNAVSLQYLQRISSLFSNCEHFSLLQEDTTVDPTHHKTAGCSEKLQALTPETSVLKKSQKRSKKLPKSSSSVFCSVSQLSGVVFSSSHHLDWQDTPGKGRAAHISHSSFGFYSCSEVFLFKMLRF